MFKSANHLPLRALTVAALAWGTLAAPAWADGHGHSAASPVSAAAIDGLGRAATPAEIAAWDIDVRPDLKGLPPGRGTVMKGQEVWDAQCASCHGVFGESNEVFTPIIGGTTPDDFETGRTASLYVGAGFPQRTSMQKLSSISTLWDYINRAMPWTAPKTLSVEEVYAVTGYILHLADLLPADGELSHENMAEIQARLPNRNGMTTEHGMWLVSDSPDVQGSDCMSNCATEVTVTSELPDFARDAHGNLQEQMRTWGPVIGADTTQPPLTEAMWKMVADGRAPVIAAAGGAAASAAGAEALNLAALSGTLSQFACAACHAANTRMVGPSWAEIGQKYSGQSDAQAYLEQKIVQGGVGVWGQIPMPAQPNVPAEQVSRIAQWLAAGAP